LSGKSENKYILRLFAVLLAALLMVLAGCGGGQTQPTQGKKEDPKEKGKPIKMVITHEVSTTHWKHGYMERYTKLVEERTGGRVKCELYPSSQLFSDRDAVAALGTGSVQMVWPVSVNVEPLNEAYGIINMPYTLTDEIMQKNPQFKSDLMKFLSAQVESKNIKVMGLIRTSNYIFIFKSRETTGPDDLKGLKIRVTGGQVVLDWLKEIGCSPIGMPASEMSTALTQGIIDGILTSPQGWVEIVGSAAKTGMDCGSLVISTYSALVDNKWWEGLPPDIQKILQDSFDELAADQWQYSIDEDRKAMEKAKNQLKAKVHNETKEDEALWLARTKPAIDRFAAKHPDAFKKFVDLNEKYGRKYPPVK